MKKTVAVLAAMIAGAAAVLVSSPAQAATPRIQIRSILLNPAGKDTAANAHLNQEYVQLRNTTGATISMSGWTLRDRSAHVYTFPAGSVLVSNGTFYVRTGKGTNNYNNRYQNRGYYVWNNDTDAATLRTNTNVTVDSCSYKVTVGKSSVAC